MYCDREPPLEDHNAKFPTLDTVTVANCWYYLSLLERFVNVTSNMSDKVLKIYLVRAEYRYFRWIANKGARKRDDTLPPLDVAFFWQAHMLSPFRFYEDTLRVEPYKSDLIPLKEIHNFQTNRDPKVLAEWRNFMKDINYDLTEEVIKKNEGNASVRCVVCNMRMEVAWDEYTEWRTDHSVALQCHCCGVMFTVKHVGKANLLADNARVHKTASHREHELLLPLKDIKSLPFNKGLGPLEDLLKAKKATRNYNTNLKESEKNVINALQSTYLCTPYRASSIDMIQAVARQYKFAVKATKVINWNTPDGIVKGIRNYASFLAVIHDNKSIVAVPTYEIDLAWHTHMLSALAYRDFCYKIFNRLINHDDTISEENLKDHVKQTDIAWKQRNDRSVFLNLPTLPESRPVSPTISEVEREEAEKAREAFEAKEKGEKKKAKNAEPENTKKKSLKKKIVRLMSFKKKKDTTTISHLTNTTYVASPKPPIQYVTSFLDPKDIYCDERTLFLWAYNEGTYKLSSPYKYISEETKASQEKYDEKSNPSKEDRENEGLPYDKEEISFHDRRDIKDFVKLNNSNNLMDSKFKETKKSPYGFIGTSNCGKGKIPVYNPKGLKNIPELEKSNRKKYNDIYKSQNTSYNTAGDNFNWYNISMMWYDSLIDSSRKAHGDCGGFSNCGSNQSSRSRCAGISSSCDNISSNSSLTGNSSAYNTTVYSGCGNTSGNPTYSSSGGHSSYGGSSSCGGSSSSCGGSSSSCGGGGGSSCGSSS
ncbi:hypothetical protein HPULCUR_002125 [Helicostylum pulchrum]|uniref:GATA-type domain-containing protein n=1 Tax=Helicostylum pulchrum TaxID=562976 RepID=A0ABP9XQX4_9FUNG